MALGDASYRRAAAAMCASGIATFALIYSVQPLMPAFSVRFGVSPAVSSLSLAVSTGVLTVAIFLGSIASERFGRKRVMAVSMLAAGLLNLACAAAPDWPSLLAIRTLEGLAAGGVPAVAMAYLAEEMDPRGLTLAMAVYVSGNGFGGMLGRLVAGAVADVAGWRAAMAAIGVVGLAAAFVFVRLLPPSRNFTPRLGLGAASHLALFRRLLGDRRLLALLGTGLLITGPFVSIYDYAGYRLVAPPYRLGQGAIGLIFLVYLVGIVGSNLFGRLADRVGRRPMLFAAHALMLLGVAVTLAPPLAAIVVGIALVTFGFFGAHAVASAWVGVAGREANTHASALYLFCFYLGMTAFGGLGGIAWQAGRWPGVVAMSAALILAALALAQRLK